MDDIRRKMHGWRVEADKTLQSLSVETGISITLLDAVENGGVTHPEIAKRIAKAYNLNDEEAKSLMPKNTGPVYEHNHKIIIAPRTTDEGVKYIAERQKKGQC